MNTQTPHGYKRTDIGIIPSDWEVVPMKEHAKLINGRAYALHEWENRGTPVIRLQNLTGRGEVYYYSNLRLPEKQYCDFGDILFMWSATFGPVIWKNSRAIFHYHIWKVEVAEDYLNKNFLFYLLDNLTEHLKKSASNGGTMLHVTKKSMEEIPIIFPTLAEQTRIATALGDTDALIAALETLIAKKRMIKHGAMQELLRPKEGWEVRTLGEVAVKISNGFVYKPSKSMGLRVTRIETISNGVVDFSKVGYAEDEPNLQKYMMRKHDILFSHINSIEHIGKVAYYNNDEELYHGMNLLLIRVDELCVDSRFLFIWLGSEIGRAKSKKMAKQAINQASISTRELKETLIMLPPIPEQTRIATILTEMDAEIEALERRLEKVRLVKQGMMQSLLTGKVRLA